MRRRTRTPDEKKWRSISVVEYFAEEERHTIKDAEKEFGISRETLERDMRYLLYLISDGEFRNNPKQEKYLKLAYIKAKKRLNSNRFHPENIAKANEARAKKASEKKMA